MTHIYGATPGPEPKVKMYWRMALGTAMVGAALLAPLPIIPVEAGDPWYLRLANIGFRLFLIVWGSWLGWSTVVSSMMHGIADFVARIRRGKTAEGAPKERRSSDGTRT